VGADEAECGWNRPFAKALERLVSRLQVGQAQEILEDAARAVADT
jgi:hypothetical protein